MATAPTVTTYYPIYIPDVMGIRYVRVDTYQVNCHWFLETPIGRFPIGSQLWFTLFNLWALQEAERVLT